MEPAIIGLVGVVIGAALSTGVTYLLALRKEATETRNWRRDKLLDAYSDFLHATESVVSETAMAYGMKCGTEEHAKQCRIAFDKVAEMHRTSQKILLLSSHFMQPSFTALTQYIAGEFLTSSIQCPKISVDERAAINKMLSALMAEFMLRARQDVGTHMTEGAAQEKKKAWWRFCV
jgi:hypothetical protein